MQENNSTSDTNSCRDRIVKRLNLDSLEKQITTLPLLIKRKERVVLRKERAVLRKQRRNKRLVPMIVSGFTIQAEETVKCAK